MQLQYLGHSFFKFRFGNTTILADPFISSNPKNKSIKTLVKCPINEKALGKVDIVLLSQEHFDHFDKKTVEYLCEKQKVCVVAHESILQELAVEPDQKKAIKSGDKFTLLGVEIEVMHAHFPKSFYPVGYIIRDKKSSVFFAGDTSLTDHLNYIKADIALLPIGGSDTMDVVDAVKATKTIKPKFAIPMHYNTFENIKADPHDFKARIEKSILKTVPVILKPGQNFSL